MKIGKPDETKIIVTIKSASRDNREKIDGKPNKLYGKIRYETLESIDIFEATPAEVKEAVLRGITTASKK